MHTPLVSKLAASLSAAVFAIAASIAATSMQAQNTLKANVPFAFESGTTHFAPGLYTIHLNAGRPVIRIEGAKQSAFQMTLPDSAITRSETSKLVFHRFGEQYILKEIWVAGRSSHLTTPTSKLEQNLKLAQAQSKDNKQGSLALVTMPQ